MKSYTVEIMAGELASSSKVTVADGPEAAAVKVTGRAVRDRKSDIHWVRVTDQTDHAIYKFAFK
ncbi:hypothetical protein [Mesorhizobium sp. WSM4313]|uniref:hypothetical protein n=1 Tax=Mesorhizobium sp. WSM4313 TaxID=2029412 RepID=UPI000BB0A227|nr:hypothetical protein [Mesorhizobium sp. WSM4313]PBB20548.1 hypothetical protein CK219_05260 [Mesorhizobium sp. WSM4313]